MKRRQYLHTISGLALSTPAVTKTATALTPTTKTETKEKPVYYTIKIPPIDTTIVHFSIQKEHYNNSDYLWVSLEDEKEIINISHDTTEKPGELFNFTLPNKKITNITANGVSAQNWDELTKHKIGILTVNDASHSILELIGDETDFELYEQTHSTVYTNVNYQRIRVNAQTQAELSLLTHNTGKTENIPIFEIEPRHRLE